MAVINIGFGVGLNTVSNRKRLPPPKYLSCFATGIWENEGYWFNKDRWKMEPVALPFLPTGIWNYEGIYRFKDKFSFGPSFLPTGYFMYDGVYRYTDKFVFNKI